MRNIKIVAPVGARWLRQTPTGEILVIDCHAMIIECLFSISEAVSAARQKSICDNGADFYIRTLYEREIG